MNNNISEIKSNINTHPASIPLSRIVKDNNIANEILNTLSISCLSESIKVLLYSNPNALYCYFIGLDCKEAFLYLIKNFFLKDKMDPYINYKIIKAYEKVTKEELYIFKLFNLLGWSSGKKGLSYYKEFENFSPILVSLIKNKKASLNEAYNFHMVFLRNYENILDLLFEDLTYSENNFILKAFSEIAKRGKLDTLNLFELLQKEKFVKKDALIEFVYKLRFPYYSKCLKKFMSFLKDFNFPKSVKINYDKTFERNFYSMEIDFKSVKDLQKKISSISKELNLKISEKDFKDLFSEKELFVP